jgi:CSLREA domain-containing protein
VALIGFELALPATAAVITVNYTGDESDPVPADGVCGTQPPVRRGDPSSGPCTLRAAIQTANAAGASTIVVAIPASDPFCSGGVCTINLTQALPDITVNTEIDGPGADKLTVRPGTGVAVRNFNVTATGVVTFFGLTISNGSNSSGIGGGIFNASSGTVNVIQCAINNNGGFVEGAGIRNDGVMNVTNSTFSGNSGGTGGGILNRGTANISNSTFSGNHVTSAGGVANLGGTVNLTNCTITGNSVSGGPGGGMYNSAGTFNVKSSLIAMNTSSATNQGLDADGNFVSAGFNLIGKRDRSAGFTAATDQTGTVASPLDPKLDSNGLQNNGGPTKTIALLFWKPCHRQSHEQRSDRQSHDRSTRRGVPAHF